MRSKSVCVVFGLLKVIDLVYLRRIVFFVFLFIFLLGEFVGKLIGFCKFLFKFGFFDMVCLFCFVCWCCFDVVVVCGNGFSFYIGVGYFFCRV